MGSSPTTLSAAPSVSFAFAAAIAERSVLSILSSRDFVIIDAIAIIVVMPRGWIAPDSARF